MRALAQFDLENVGRALLPVHGPTSKLCFQELAAGLSFDKKNDGQKDVLASDGQSRHV